MIGGVGLSLIGVFEAQQQRWQDDDPGRGAPPSTCAAALALIQECPTVRETTMWANKKGPRPVICIVTSLNE